MVSAGSVAVAAAMGSMAAVAAVRGAARAKAQG